MVHKKCIYYRKLFNQFILRNKRFILIMLFLNLNIFSDIGGQINILNRNMIFVVLRGLGWLLCLWFGILVITLLVTKIKNRFFQQVIKILMIFLSFILLISDAFMLYTYGTAMDASMIELILGTNPHTVIEFVGMYMFTPNCIVALVIMILITLILFIISRGFIITFNRHENFFAMCGFIGMLIFINRMSIMVP